MLYSTTKYYSISDCSHLALLACYCSLHSTVGISGQVYSFESVPGHMHAAMNNYRQWRGNWELVHYNSLWPDNVEFIGASVDLAGDHVTSPVDVVMFHYWTYHCTLCLLVQVLVWEMFHV